MGDGNELEEAAEAPAAPAAPRRQRYLLEEVGSTGSTFRVLDDSNPEHAEELRLLAGTPGIEQVLTPMDREQADETEQMMQRDRAIQFRADQSNVLEGAAVGVAQAGSFGTLPALVERFAPEEAQTRFAGMQRGQPEAIMAGEVATDLATAFITGPRRLGQAGIGLATGGGLAQAATNTLERYALSAMARRGLSQGTRQFLAGSLANIGVGVADVGIRAGLDYAITGRPVEAEALLGAGGIVSALGLGVEGLAAVGRGARGLLSRRLPRVAAEQADRLRNLGMGAELREGADRFAPGFISERRAPRRPIISEEADAFIGAFGGGLDQSNVEQLQVASAVDQSFAQGARQRSVRDIAGDLQSLFDDVSGPQAQSITNSAERERLIRSAVGDADGRALRERLGLNADALRREFGSIPGEQGRIINGVLDRIDELARGPAPSTAGTPIERAVARAEAARGGHRSAADTIVAADRLVDELTQRNLLQQVRTGPAAERAVSAVEAALDVLRRAPGETLSGSVDGTLLAGIAERQNLLQDFRLRSAFEQNFTRPSGGGRRRVDPQMLQDAFDEDAIRSTSPRGQLEMEEWIRTADRMLEAEGRANPRRAAEVEASRAKLVEMGERLGRLRELSEANAATREVQGIESKNAQLLASLGFGGGAIGALVGGPMGAVVGAGFGLTAGLLTHPAGALRRAASIKSWFRRGETRAATSLRGLETALSAPRPPASAALGRGTDLRAASRALPRTAARLLEPDSGPAEYAAIRQQIREAATGTISERLQTLVGPLGDVNPDLAGHTALGITSAAQYLNSTLVPTVGEGTLFGPLSERRPSRTERLELSRRLAIAEDPWYAVDLAASGRLTATHAEAFRAMYPQLHRATAAYVSEMVASLDRPPPYSVRMQTGLLLGIETDPTLDPAFIARMQERSAQTPQQQRASFGGRASMTAASRVSDGLTTQTQRVTVGM